MLDDQWAHGRAGAASEHLWRAIKPMTVTALRRSRHDEL
jgi:hypothetical protein